MTKILVGMAAAAFWLALSQVSHAERVCGQVCDQGTCVSECVDHPDAGVVIHDHDRYRDDRPGVGLHAPGVDIDVGR